MERVLVERGANYADIADNSASFAALMAVQGIDKPRDMSDVEFHCLANISTKLARMSMGSRTHEDNWVDIANYAVLALACLRRENVKKDTPTNG